jgi:hypothetical protein
VSVPAETGRDRGPSELGAARQGRSGERPVERVDAHAAGAKLAETMRSGSHLNT